MTFGYPPKTKPATPVPATLDALQEKLDGRYPKTGDLTATYAASPGQPVKYLDTALNFFVGPWVTGQGSAGTTLTAQAAAGSTTLAVSSGTSFPNGTIIITNQGTTLQRQYKVTSGGGSTALTVTPAVVTTLANGATITPLWTNSSHLTAEGYAALFWWVVQSTAFTTAPGSKPVVLLGNSWGAGGFTSFAAAITTRYPGTTVTNASVSGNTSNQFLARFDTDVAGTPSYVVFNEPGVNDMLTNKNAATMAANLATLVRKIRALGAIPVYLGPVPLADIPNVSTNRATFMRNLNITSPTFPTLTPEITASIRDAQGTTNTALGLDTQPNVTGTANVAVGSSAQALLTTGSTNTAVGSNTQTALTTGTANTAVGHNAQTAATGSSNTAVGQAVQQSMTGGGGNTGVGQAAQLALTTGNDNSTVGNYSGASITTGSGNTGIGTRALYRPAGSSANVTDIGSNNTAIGAFTGQAGAGNTAYLLAAGYYAVAGTYATALGANTKASSTGSVAIGTDNSGNGAQATAQNDFVLGVAAHKVKVPGTFNVAQKTPASSADAMGAVGDITTDDNYVYVKTSTGWKRSALTTF